MKSIFIFAKIWLWLTPCWRIRGYLQPHNSKRRQKSEPTQWCELKLADICHHEPLSQNWLIRTWFVFYGVCYDALTATNFENYFERGENVSSLFFEKLKTKRWMWTNITINGFAVLFRSLLIIFDFSILRIDYWLNSVWSLNLGTHFCVLCHCISSLKSIGCLLAVQMGVCSSLFNLSAKQILKRKSARG